MPVFKWTFINKNIRCECYVSYSNERSCYESMAGLDPESPQRPQSPHSLHLQYTNPVYFINQYTQQWTKILNKNTILKHRKCCLFREDLHMDSQLHCCALLQYSFQILFILRTILAQLLVLIPQWVSTLPVITPMLNQLTHIHDCRP